MTLLQKALYRLIRIIPMVVVWCIDFVVPKNPSLWVFALGSNKHWAGNIRALYEHVKDDNKICKIILITKPIKELKKVQNGVIVSAKSLKGLWILLRAFTIIIQYHRHEYFWEGITNRNRLIVNLWHGIVVKGFAFTAASGYTTRQLNRFRKDSLNYSAIISSSYVDRLVNAASFNVPFSRVWITGLPRNDWLLQKSSELPRDLYSAEQGLNDQLNGRRLVLYAPTFRKSSTGLYDFSPAEIDDLSFCLRKNNAVMGIRSHISLSAQLSLVERPDFLDLSVTHYPETQVVLRMTDVLVTDYSSIWVDFLLTGKQIVGFIYDWDEYASDRDIIYDYEHVFPGAMALNCKAFIDALDKALNDEIPDAVKLKYRNSLSMFHKYKDGHASERVVRAIIAKGRGQ